MPVTKPKPDLSQRKVRACLGPHCRGKKTFLSESSRAQALQALRGACRECLAVLDPRDGRLNQPHARVNLHATCNGKVGA